MPQTARKPITITGSSGGAQTDYQVRVDVTYDADMKADFGDVRFTNSSSDPLKYWRESKVDSTSAIFWVKVPSIPSGAGTVTIYMYYGDAGLTDISNGETVFELYDDFGGHLVEIYPTNETIAEVSTAGYIAENIVYDSVTAKYWWIFEDRTGSPSAIRLASSDNADGPWTVEGSSVISDASHQLVSPHIALFGSTWYIYYGKCDTTSTPPADIYCKSSSTVNSGYASEALVLSRGGSGTWDERRVLEPYVFFVGSTYYLFYMGEDTGEYEKTGYATSSSPGSGFTKYGSNPVLSGNTGAWNGGRDRAADPFVFLKDGIYYIGVTACTSGADKSQWTVGFYKTTDFINFEELLHNPALPHGTAGNFDEIAVLRGAMQYFGGTYYLSYTGVTSTNYRMGIAASVQFNQLLLPNTVDTEKWTISGSPTQGSGTISTSGSNYINSDLTFGTNRAMRAKALHGSSGFPAIAFRLYDGTNQDALEWIANVGGAGDLAAYQWDTAWANGADRGDPTASNIYDILRNGSTSGIYYLNDSLTDTLSTQVPTTSLPISAFNNIVVDFVLVRKYINPEPTISIGLEESLLSLAVAADFSKFPKFQLALQKPGI